MSHDKIQQLVNSLAKKVENNEKLATPILAAKLAMCLNEYPGDQTIGSMARVISKLAENNTLFIRKAELQKLYQQLHSRNSKFAELFADELGVTNVLPEPQLYQRDDSTSELNPFEVGDAVLANALNSVFDKHAPLKEYAQNLADKALSNVTATLDSWNLKPSSVCVDDGNTKFLVIKADYETPKGITSFYVPVEITNKKIAAAAVFMGNAGPQELNYTNIKAYLTKFPGNKLKVNATGILNVLTKAASEDREITDTEIALIKLNASRQGTAEFFQNQIVGQKIAESSRQDVSLPKSNEFVSFEKQFNSPQGVASFKFGATVSKGIEHIARELKGYGHKNPQISVEKSDDKTIFYSVSLDAGRVGFVVPVKVAGDKIVKPTVMLCNGSVSSFSSDGINELYVNNYTDYKAAASASPLFELKASDILNDLKSALIDENYEKAGDALNVLAHRDQTAHAMGFQLLKQSLAGKSVVKTASAAVTCSNIIKNSTSEHPICAHTGLPAHKVYQDKEGNCRPLYRRSMDETYEGAIFNNSKIFG